MTRFFTYLSLLIGFGLPSLYFLISGFLPLSFVPVFLGCCWLASIKFRWSWVYNLLILTSTVLLALDIFLFFPHIIAIISAVFILVAWDLSNYQILLDRVNKTKNLAQVERSHLGKLVIFILLATSISLGAVLIEFQVSFNQSVILLVISFIGLLQLTRWLLNRNKLN